ncbi:hypothetical protein [Ancylomarina sp.]|uniref:hypothetical protein n=1 Tax=Ancylomarina sp. TaxID=1970196 RepID=UPI00356689AC
MDIFFYIARTKPIIIMLQKRFFYTILFLLGFLNLSLQAQQTNPFFCHYGKFKADAKEKLFFRFENLNFAKNDEYKGEFVKGATYIGYVATPKIVYYPADDLRIEAGIRLQKYSGLAEYPNSEPVFSVHYQASSSLSLILGTLNQDNNHYLHEALFEPERFFADRAENGLQALFKSERLDFDTWINWEQFIFQNDPFQEVFTFGLTAGLRLINLESSHSLTIPLQVLFTHRGGEIDSSDSFKQTIGHFGTGLTYSKAFDNSFFKKINIEAFVFLFRDNSSIKEFAYGKGKGFDFRIGAETKHSSLKLGYWIGDKFNSSRGSAFFQSMSVIDNNYIQKRREIVTAKYRIQKSIAKGIILGGQVDTYIDMSSSHDFSYATSLFVKINGEFFLKKLDWK